MEKKIFLEAVAKACHLESEAVFVLNSVPQRDIVNKYILPYVAGVHMDNIRYNRITGTYMKFVADYGRFCIEQDRETGELLMELALQRLSNGAVLFDKGIHLINILPDAYKKYTAAYDELGLMGSECWNFVKTNLVWCIQNLSTASYRAHAELILMGLMVHLNPDGSTNHGYMWNNERYVGATVAEAYEWVETAAKQCLCVDAIAQRFAREWRLHKVFLKKNFNYICWDKFFEQIDLDAESYYTGMAKTTYKLLGVYNKKTREKIQSEIKSCQG